MVEESIGRLFRVRNADPSPLQGGQDPEVYVVSVFVQLSPSGVPSSVTVSGLAAQSSKIYGTFNLDGAEVGADIEGSVSQNSGEWEISQPLPANGAVLVVRVRDEQSRVADSVILQIASLGDPVPAGVIGPNGPHDVELLAGSPDRQIRTRSFGLIETQFLSPFDTILNRADAAQIEIDSFSVISSDDSRRVEIPVSTYRTTFQEEVTRIQSEAADRVMDDGAIRRLGQNRAIERLREHLEAQQLSRTDRARLAKMPHGGVEFDARARKAVVVLPRIDAYRSAPLSAQTLGLNDFATKIVIAFSQPSRLGVCFDEHLRFRPAGLVRGEPLYTLAMDAGEEVQLRQSSETIRRATVEDIVDRESEFTTTLSSTWSTDVSSAFNESQTDSSNWNVGGDAGFAGVPKVPVNLGVSGGVSASAVAQNTIGLTTRNAFEMSRQAVVRLRAQHKTRMEIQDQTTIGVSSVRTLNNRGAVRPRRLDFRKMYRKEMVTYERHDARLCLKLLVDDPGRTIRQEFKTNLDAVDPDSEAHYDAVISPPDSIEQLVEVKWRPSQDVVIFPFETTSTETLQIDVKNDGDASIPSDFVLVRRPSLVMKSMTVYWPAGPFDDDPYETYTAAGNGLIETAPGIKVVSHSVEYMFNNLNWLTPWTAKSPQGTGTLQFIYENSICPLGTISVKEIELEIRSEWARPDNAMDAVAEQRAEIREQVEGKLTPERVLRLRDVAIADYSNEVLSLAIRTNLLAGSRRSRVNPSDFHAWFAIEDAYIENAPYWATTSGVDRYSELRSRLGEMNLQIPLSEILIPELTASQAVLFLPIRTGAEEDALALLPEYTEEEAAALISEFRNYREQTFGDTAAADNTPTYDSVSSPAPVEATPFGEAEWKTNWEPPQRKFQVLAHWADFVPTDGVDAITALSDSSRADEAVLRALRKDETSLS